MKKIKITGTQVRRELEQFEDPEYREFNSRLLPGIDNILGVRLPILRKLAKDMAKMDWQEWFEETGTVYYEENMLRGLIIACAKLGVEERLSCIREFVPRIDNWGVCDSFCSSLKDARKYPGIYWEFLKPYLVSGEEYEVRFGAVMLLDHFVKEEYLWESLSLLESVHHEGYYAKMAVAWAVSVYFAAFPEEVYGYLEKEHKLDAFTWKKALQKILESYRVTGDLKNRIRELRQRG